MVAKLFQDELSDKAPRLAALMRAIDDPELSGALRAEKERELDALIADLTQKEERALAEVTRLSSLLEASDKPSGSQPVEPADPAEPEGKASRGVPSDPIGDATTVRDAEPLATKGYSEVLPYKDYDSDADIQNAYYWKLISSPELENVYLVVQFPHNDETHHRNLAKFASLETSPAMPANLPSLLLDGDSLGIDARNWTAATTTDLVLIRTALLKDTAIGVRTLHNQEPVVRDNAKLISGVQQEYEHLGVQYVLARDGAFGDGDNYAVLHFLYEGRALDRRDLATTALVEDFRRTSSTQEILPHALRSITGKWLSAEWETFRAGSWADVVTFKGRKPTPLGVVFKCAKTAVGPKIASLFRDLDLVKLGELEKPEEDGNPFSTKGNADPSPRMWIIQEKVSTPERRPPMPRDTRSVTLTSEAHDGWGFTEKQAIQDCAQKCALNILAQESNLAHPWTVDHGRKSGWVEQPTIETDTSGASTIYRAIGGKMVKHYKCKE